MVDADLARARVLSKVHYRQNKVKTHVKYDMSFSQFRRIAIGSGLLASFSVLHYIRPVWYPNSTFCPVVKYTRKDDEDPPRPLPSLVATDLPPALWMEKASRMSFLGLVQTE